LAKPIKMKNKLIIVLTVCLVLLPGLTMCTVNFPFGTKGSGNVIEQVRDVPAFNEIEVSGGIDMYLTQDDVHKVVAVTDDNLQALLITKVEDGKLKIYLSEGVHGSKSLKVNVTIKDIKGITISGGSDMYCEQPVVLGKIELTASGGSDARLNVKAIELSASASGGSDVYLKGAAGYLNLSASGGSDCKAFELTAAKANVSASGGSDVFVTVDQELKANASGGSDVKYKGNATIVKVESSGGSDIIKE
jgi:hypothetical protein